MCCGQEDITWFESDQHSTGLACGWRFLQVFQRQLEKGLHLRIGRDLCKRCPDPPKTGPGDVRDIYKNNGVLWGQGCSLGLASRAFEQHNAAKDQEGHNDNADGDFFHGVFN